ncbi:MAG: ATP-binding protein [Eubacterium sp.]|nr:ATP-binding protein [Eubacterium sp.]
MTKTLKNVRKNDKEKLKSIKFVQDSIPLEQFYDDGIFLIQSIHKKLNKYSATFQIRDVSYLTLSDEMQRQLFLAWAAVLNVLDPGATNKLSVIKHKIGTSTIERFKMHNKNPNYAALQKEYNKIIAQKALQGNGMVQEVYLTISVNKKDYQAARNFFLRTVSTLQTQLVKLGSACEMLNGKARLELLHDIYRGDKENEPEFDLSQTLIRGSSAKDFIAPESMEFENDYFKMGSLYGRALVLHNYPTYLKDSIVSDLCDINSRLIWSMDIIPVPTDEAVNEAEKRATSVEANISKWFQKQYNNKNYAAEPPYDLKQQREQAQEYLTDLTERDQHLMYAVVTMVHFAESKQQLDDDTESIMASARTARCRLNILRWQQLDGLNTALPLGVRRIEDIMTLTTEGIAGFIPFKSMEMQEENGFCFGQNQISKNLITINPKNRQSFNSVLLGVPGSGKSMTTKWLILTKILATADDQHEVIIIDPEREYAPLVKELGGEVVYLSVNSKTHINAMSVSAGYDKSDNPITTKAEFMLSLCEHLMYPTVINAKHRSLIDRCTDLVLSDYVRKGCEGVAPTLFNFYECMKEQPEPEAQDIALSIEIYAKGSLSTFANQTNVNIKNRIICFDILELGDNLMSIGMLVLFDHIQNRMIKNRTKGITTSVVNDEFYMMFQREFTSNFFYKMWKRGRKYGVDYSGITQNTEDLLRSPNGRAILSTSELIIMLNQAPLDKQQLSELLNLSENQEEYIDNAKEGAGLIKMGGTIVPFENDIPKDSKIYKLFTTKLGEAIYDSGE